MKLSGERSRMNSALSDAANNADLKQATDEQLAKWLARFAVYRQPPTRETLLAWLDRFAPEHLSIAHRILDVVEIVSEIEIHKGYKAALSALPGWSTSTDNRKGRWYFVGFGGAGESGAAMLRIFREANDLTSAKWNPFFVTVRELPSLALSAFDNVVFVDDFAGTGTQIAEYWPTLQELIASEARCYMILTAATTDAIERLRRETELELSVQIELSRSKNIYSDESVLFTKNERDILDEYGRTAWGKHPRGFGGCGLTFVLSHKTPNNTLPVLHANHDKWQGPFPRQLLGRSR